MARSPHMIQAGRAAVPLDKPETRHIPTVERIARSLGNLCRFTGHVEEFYSVAEHSVLLAMLVCRQDGGSLVLPRTRTACQFALIHDVQENLLGDVATPLKRMECMKGYRRLEDDWQISVIDRFFDEPPPKEYCKAVMELDAQVVVIEGQRFLEGGLNPDVWGEEALTFDPEWKEWFLRNVIPLAPAEAAKVWLRAYGRLFDEA